MINETNEKRGLNVSSFRSHLSTRLLSSDRPAIQAIERDIASNRRLSVDFMYTRINNQGTKGINSQ